MRRQEPGRRFQQRFDRIRLRHVGYLPASNRDPHPLLAPHRLAAMPDKTWWRDAAIYQIYPRSFQDTNGDGEGDLAGAIQHLPYLKKLGVDAIWLSPFYKSPNKDGGYDVADPRDVDPRFGTLDNAKELVKQTHSHGIRIIFDIIPNHFSSEHIWFQEALRSTPGSAARNRFHFYDGRGEGGKQEPNNWNSLFGGPSWTRVIEADGTPGQWYLHLFDSSQPDLNWDNPDVRADFEKTLRFWLDLGVDGFRIDVAHGLAKDEILIDHHDPEGLSRALRLDLTDISKKDRNALLSDIPFFDREGVHEIYREWRKVLNSYSGDRMTVAEAWVHPSARAARYVRSDELHQIFNFDFLMIDWDAHTIQEAINRTLAEAGAVGAPATWVLSNHDSARVVSRLGDEGKARALALLTHSLPGGIYIYQGEELGLPDAALPDEMRQDPAYFRTKGADKGRDGCRVPLPWDSSEPNFGYTTGKPWLPQPIDWKVKSVDVEEADSASFLNFYRRSLKLRKEHPALGGEGAITWHPAPVGVLHFSREPGLIVAANTTANQVTLEVAATTVLHQSAPAAGLSNQTLTLPAHTTVWLQK
jgi:alpha-glucosidase